MRKVVVKLQGGLGNQMFQYAFGKYISNRTDRKLIVDTSFLDDKNRGPDFAYRDYDLDIFDLNHEIVGEFLEPYEHMIEDFNSIHKVDYNIISRALNSDSNNIYLDGYWPSPKYFKNEIDFFKFKNPIENNSLDLAEEIKKSNSIMVNVRRTDFVNNDYHGTYGKDYILKGLEKINDIEDRMIYIFSDDIEWCKENLSDLGYIVTHDHKGYKFSNYLQLMSLCKWFIIPNSSFAWWSAFLSKSKIDVIYPEKFLNVPPYTFHNMYPKEWIRI